jgi:hypothetical protein
LPILNSQRAGNFERLDQTSLQSERQVGLLQQITVSLADFFQFLFNLFNLDNLRSLLAQVVLLSTHLTQALSNRALGFQEHCSHVVIIFICQHFQILS